MARASLLSSKRFVADETAAAGIEFALVFPIMLILLLGIFDVGNALMAGQKTIVASQIIADLIARNVEVDDDMIDDIVRAGQLALDPVDTADMGVDIVSIEYDSDDEPQVVWRETRDMTEDPEILDRAEGLGVEGDGLLAVTVDYQYRPVFGNIVIDTINMRERAYARGRRTAIVCKIEGATTICAAS